MRIKVFQAATMKEAMAQVKDELGTDAVILHTKRIKKGGILGYGSKEIFEVTAALDEVPRKPPKKRVERLPTLAELQAAETAGTADSVPLPQGIAAAAPAVQPLPRAAAAAEAVPLPAAMAAPVPLAAPLTAPAPSAALAAVPDDAVPLAAAPSPMQQPAAVPAPVVQKTQARLSRNAARSYKTAGTEAAIAEAQVHLPPPASAAASPDGAAEEAFRPLLPKAEEKAVRPVRTRRKKTAAKPKGTRSRKVSPIPEEAEERAAAPVPRKKAPRSAGEKKKVLPAAPPQASEPMEEPPLKSEEERQKETIEELQNELAQMKAMLVQVVNKEKKPEDELSLQQALRLQDIEPEIIDDIVLQLPAEAILADKDTPQAREGLKKYLMDNVQMADGLEIKSRRRKIAALLGPTGVGKTTTLAKIAAQCVLEKGISTAFITADTYRISAVEQLKTYADILGLPIAIVYSPQELKEAIQKFRQKQLILIDTAGRSQHNRRQMAELKDFLAVNQNIEKYLVLSATTKNEDAKDILEKFSVCRPDKVIFTKTDETKSLGVILNILRRQEMRLSYLTNGQSVPDDIAPAEAGKLAELFLR